MKKTPLGERRHLVTLDNPGPAVPDGDGGYTTTWTPLDPAELYVSIERATAKSLERITAATVLSMATHIMKGAYHPQVTTKTQVTWTDVRGGTHTASVTDPINTEERNEELVMVVAEVVA